MFGQLVEYLVGWLLGVLVAWLASRLVGSVLIWFGGLLAGQYVGCGSRFCCLGSLACSAVIWLVGCC